MSRSEAPRGRPIRADSGRGIDRVSCGTAGGGPESAGVAPAAVASSFERMVRIADSIGIELGDWMETFTEAVRTDLAPGRRRERSLSP